MTKEEILKMEPGPELDALVAEKVMGHPIPDFIPENALELYLVGKPIHYDSWTCICRYDEGDIPKWVPDSYSTDILAAWQVVERMSQLAYDISLLLHSIEVDPILKIWLVPVWYCDFRPRGDVYPPKYKWVDHQNTAPETICKAALLVKLEE